MKKEDTQEHLQIEKPRFFPCKKIRAGEYKYRGWIIQCVGYYTPDHRVAWEGYDPDTGHGDFRGFSKREIKWQIDDSLAKEPRHRRE